MVEQEERVGLSRTDLGASAVHPPTCHPLGDAGLVSNRADVPAVVITPCARSLTAVPQHQRQQRRSRTAGGVGGILATLARSSLMARNNKLLGELACVVAARSTLA